MRKLIAAACAVIALGFAAPLAGADETSGVSAGTNPDTGASTQQSTCTDSKGVTYSSGKEGFDTCIAQMKNASKSDKQMSGITGGDPQSNGWGNPNSPNYR